MRLLLIAFLTLAFLFTACSNDSSISSSDDKTVNYLDVLDTMGVATEFDIPCTYTANEKEHKLKIIHDAKTLDACVAEENNYTWKTISVADEDLDYWYEFWGDTLLLYRFYPEEYDSSSSPKWEDRRYGLMFVGGKSGQLEGTWDYIGCEYTSYSHETNCYGPLDDHTATSLKISGNTATIIKKRYYEKYLDEINAAGYVNVLMLSLYNALAEVYGRDVSIGDYWELYVGGVAETLEDISRYQVKMIDSTENSKTFSIGDKTYTFKVIKAEQSLSKYNNIFMDLNVEVSDGTTTCVGYYKTQYIEKSQCSAEGYNNSFKEIGYDSKGDSVHYAYEHLDQNMREFNDCLDKIAAKTYHPDYDLKDSEK